MLNLAGTSYDVTNVLFAVLQECEHRRRSLLPNEAERRLLEIAREKLGEIERSYRELGGTDGYWRDIAQEVMVTAMPQYIASAVEQNRVERDSYGVWRNADPLARVVFCLIGLTIGGIIVALPFIPIWEDSFAFALALGGFLYPEIVRGYYEHRHSRRLNRLIARAEKYQNDRRLHYETEASLDEELGALATPLHGKAEARALGVPGGEASRSAEPAAHDAAPTPSAAAPEAQRTRG